MSTKKKTNPTLAHQRRAAEKARLAGKRASENDRLANVAKHRAAELAVLTSVQKALTDQFDIQKIYDTVGEKMLDIFNVGAVTINVYDLEANTNSYVYGFEAGKRTPNITLPINKLHRYVLKNARPTFLLNTGAPQFFKRFGAKAPQGKLPKSALSVKLGGKSKQPTAVVLMDIERENAFTQNDVRLLQALANSMSVALDNARLFAEVQQRNLEITGALEQQTATSDILRAMANSPSDLQPVLVSVATNAAKLCEANDVQIYSVEGDRLTQVAHWGPLPALKDGESLPLQKGLMAGRAVLEKRTIHTKDASKLSKKQYPESVKLQKRLGHRTVVATPLIHEGKAIGLIAVRRNKVLPFTDKQIELLKTFADQASIAIENVRLFDESAKRNAELAVINSVQQGLASRLKFQEIIDLVGEKVGEIFKADTVTAGIYDAKRDWITNTYYVDRGRRVALPDRPVPRPSLSATVLDTRKPLLLGTNAEQRKTGSVSISPVEGEEDQNQSVVFVPILAGKRAIGSISVQSYQPNAYDQSDLHLLETLASSMAVALENARLFDETAQRNAELAVINSVQEAMAKELDIRGIYEAVGEKIQVIFKAQALILGAFDHTAGLVLPYYFYENGERLYPEAFPFSGLIKHLIATRRSVVINEDFAAKQKEFEMRTVAGGNTTKSAVFIPLVVGDKVIGAFTLQDDRENVFGDSDVRLLETLANSMSVALENARLFDETAQRNAELAVINSVQEAMSKQLDIKGIYEAVGEKIKDIFDAQSVLLTTLNETSGLIVPQYIYEKGERFYPDPWPITGLAKYLIVNRETVLINEDFEIEAKKFGMKTVEGTENTKSAVFVPLVAGGKTIGGISLQNMDRENAFSPSDVRLLETLANSMSVALENARLFNETTQRNAELAVINSVQESIARQIEIQGIYEAVGEQIKDIFDAQTLFFATVDSTSNLLTPRYVLEKGERLSPGPIQLTSFSGEAIAARKTLLINQGFAEEIQKRSFGPTPDWGELPKSAVYIPLIIRDTAIGIISLQNLDHENAFSDSDIRLLETLANSMSVALENARLFDETQLLLDESRKKEAELTTVNTVGQAVASEVELDSLIQLIGDQVQKIFKADISFVALLDKKDGMIHFPYIKGETLEPLKMGEGIVSQIISTGKPVHINRDESWKEVGRNVDRVGVRAKSYLGVPIMSGRQAIGAISVQSTQREGRFNDADMHLLSTIAANVGAAIENARLFAEVARQKLYFETFFKYSPAAAVVVNFKGIVTGWNPAAENLFGYSAQEAIGQNVDDLVAKDKQFEAEARDYTKQITEQLGRVEITGRRTRKDGSLVDVELKALPISIDGEMAGLLAIYHDISQFENARRAAEEANQAKSAFLANMSHELRTPLNAIIGFTRIVRRKGEGSLPEKQIENLDKVLVSAEHLLGLINTILDIAKIESGRMDVQRADFDLSALIDNCLTTTQPLVKENIKLQKTVSADLPQIHSDQEKIHRILLNLLSNAAKFTHEGSITVIASREGNMVNLTVQDTGIGIAKENLAKIFEEFQQADNTTTRQYGGTGLGLSISRSLAQLLGGDLTVSSVEGKGSAFHLTIPLTISKPSRISDGKAEVVEAAKRIRTSQPIVLVIDDQADMFHILQQNLEGAGYQVVAALSGEEGIEKARTLHPYAITLDIMMPNKDGWQVLYELKSDPATKNIPVIMLTIVDNKAMGFRLGASDYLVKPLNEKSVLEALERLAQSNGGVHPRRLLVVDDDPKVIDLVQQMLDGEDLVIETAGDGNEALKQIEGNRPDVILLDLVMPHLDGFQFIDQLRQQTDLRNIPIIVLTAKSLTNAELSQLQKNVAAIVKKQGLGGEALIQQIQKLVA